MQGSLLFLTLGIGKLLLAGSRGPRKLKDCLAEVARAHLIEKIQVFFFYRVIYIASPFDSPCLVEGSPVYCNLPFSVVVLGNFRRFFFSLFHFFSPLLDFSHIYNKFLMPFVDFFY